MALALSVASCLVASSAAAQVVWDPATRWLTGSGTRSVADGDITTAGMTDGWPNVRVDDSTDMILECNLALDGRSVWFSNNSTAPLRIRGTNNQMTLFETNAATSYFERDSVTTMTTFQSKTGGTSTTYFADNAKISATNVHLAQTAGGTAILNIQDNAQLTTTGEFMLCQANNTTATVNQSGGIVTLNGTGTKTNLIGHYNNSADSIARLATYNLSGGELRVADHLIVGWHGNSEFNISGTGKAYVTTLNVGFQDGDGATGTRYNSVSVTGADALLKATTINIAPKYHGEMTIDGGKVEATNFNIAGNSTNGSLALQGTLNILDGSLDVSGSFVLAQKPGTTATVNQSGGTVTLTGTGAKTNIIGHWAGTAVYNLSGGTLNAVGDNVQLTVGWHANSQLNISDTGQANVNILHIGHQSDSTTAGTAGPSLVSVAGQNAGLNASQINVASNFPASLNISDSASVSTTGLRAAGYAAGSLSVDNATLVIGSGGVTKGTGAATVALANNAVIRASDNFTWNADINPTLDGVVTYDTAGSTITFSGAMTNATGKAGTLNVIGGGTLDIKGGSANITTVTVSAADAGTSTTLKISNGSTLNVLGTQNAETLLLGVTGSGTGVLDVSGSGSSVTARKIFVGYTNGTSGEVNLSGGSITTANDAVIGYTGTGTLTQTGGTFSVNGSLYVGNNTGAVNSVIDISGADAALNVTNKMFLGDRATASLTAGDSATVSLGTLGFGDNGGTGTLNITDATLAIGAGGVTKGGAGNAVVNLNAGTTLRASAGFNWAAGIDPTITGTVTVDTAGNTVTFASDLLNGGGGVLKIAGGGVFSHSADNDGVGESVADGTFRRTAGETTGAITVAADAGKTATYQLQAGAVNASANVLVGTGGASGAFEMTGGSIALNNFAMRVGTGNGSTGTFTITNGTIAGGDVDVGHNNGGSGKLVIGVLGDENSKPTINMASKWIVAGRENNAYGEIVLNSGTITGGTVIVGNNGGTGVFEMYGGTIASAVDIGRGGTGGGGTFTMIGGTISGQDITVGYNNAGEFIMGDPDDPDSSPEIIVNSKWLTIGRNANSDGVFTMYSGTISGGGSGALVMAHNANSKGVFNMEGGTVSTEVRVGTTDGSATFNMNDGLIDGNVITGYGGNGNDHLFSMTGGTIDNAAVRVQNNSAFNLGGGRVRTDALTVAGTASFEMTNNGVLQVGQQAGGDATITGSIKNTGGVLDIAFQDGYHTTTITGDYTQGSDGTLRVGVESANGTDFLNDLLKADSMTLDGTLDLIFAGTYDWTANDVGQVSFSIFDGLIPSGDFSDVSANITLADGLAWQYNAASGLVTLGLESSGSGVPEPATWAMLALGLMGLAVWRRRK